MAPPEDRRPTFLRSVERWDRPALFLRRSERPGLHRDFRTNSEGIRASSFEGINVLTRRGGLFCAVNVFQRGLPLDLIARAKKLWLPHGGSRRAHTRKRETHPSLPSPHTQHCKPIFSPGRTPSCALRRMGRSVSVAEIYALESQMATATSMKSKHAHCDVHSLPC